jgi:hypothetical protein
MTGGVRRGRFSPPGSARAIWSTTLFLSPDAGRPHHGIGRAGAGLSGHSGRCRQYRAAAGGDRLAEAPTAMPARRIFSRCCSTRAAEAGVDCTSITQGAGVRRGISASLQKEIAARGVEAFQAYATAELGVIALRRRRGPGMVVNEGLIVEIVKPGTGEPVAEGEIGEIVVTRLNAIIRCCALAPAT